MNDPAPIPPSDDPLAEADFARRDADAALAAADSDEALERFRLDFLGSKGRIKGLMKLLGRVPKDEMPAAGQRLNRLQTEVQAAYDAKKGETSVPDALAAGAIDVTEPGRRPLIGRLHPLYRVTDELVELFGRMGFAVAAGPEVEDEFHNFVALNIPESHPARDPLDNFYLAAPKIGQGEPGEPGRPLTLLRTQTSTVQIRVLERQRPPVRVVIPGRVYRPDTHDDTHLSMFHQLEALVVDRGVTMVDLKSTVLQFVHAFFGPGARVRFRPSFFPFTEPSAEVDVWFDDRRQWVELGGCGMVHPNVLRAVGVDPEEFTGWAFGFGIERIAMRKYGVANIRLFVENDVRFLGQF